MTIRYIYESRGINLSGSSRQHGDDVTAEIQTVAGQAQKDGTRLVELKMIDLACQTLWRSQVS